MKVEFSKLKDVAEFIRGITFAPTDVIDDFIDDKTIAVMRTKNVQNILDLSDVWKINKSFVKSNKQYLSEGDLLVSSANSWNLVGKACWVDKLDYTATFGGFVTVLRADERKVIKKYLYYWFVSNSIQSLLRSCSNKTTNISNLNLKRAYELKIPLPPLAEQQRIAQILDTAVRLMQLRELAIVKLDQLAQSVFVEMFGDAKTTNKWMRKEISTVAKIYTGKTPSSADESNFGDEIPFVTPTDLRGMIEKSTRHISIKGAQSITTVRAGATLVGCIGDIGRVGLANFSVTFNQQINAVDWNQSVVNDVYGFYVMQYMEEVFKNRSVSAVVPILNKSNFSKIEIPIPPLIEQVNFEKFIRLIWNLKKKMLKNINIKLIASLQHELFSIN